MPVRTMMAILMAGVPIALHAQVLAPPALPGQYDVSERLVRAVEGKDVDAYAALLSEALIVTEDGQIAYRTKADWLAKFGRKLAASGVSFKMESGFSSTGRLLFIEYFNSASSWGRDVPAHCCWGYDAVAYDIADSKITAIHRLRGGDTRLEEDGGPAR